MEKRKQSCKMPKPISACSTLPHRPMRSRESDRKSTRLNSSHGYISYAVFCLKKKMAAWAPGPDLSRADGCQSLAPIDENAFVLGAMLLIRCRPNLESERHPWLIRNSVIL